MAVRGNDLFDSVVGGVNGITGGDGQACFHQLKGIFHFCEGHGKDGNARLIVEV